MARFILSNHMEWIEYLELINNKCGFQQSIKISEDYGFINYKKLNINNYNFYEKNGDFVACNGTMFYKEQFGYKALELLLFDFKKIDIKKIRKNLIGTYIIIVKYLEKIYIFIDESGNYASYYFLDNKKYLITNTFYHIAKCVNASLDKMAFIEEINEYCILDNKTIFKNIYRIMYDEMIVINIKNNSFSIKKIEVNNYSLDSWEFDKVVSLIAEKIMYYSRMQFLINQEKILFITGGMDSRLSLAGDMSVGVHPVLINWQGCPILMNTKFEDSKVSELIANKVNLVYKEIDVSNGIAKKMEENSFDKYGEYARIYGNNKKWFGFFEENDYCFYDFGYFGETLKGWDLLEQKYSVPMSIDNYIELYMNRQVHNYINFSGKDKIKYKKYISNKIHHICNKFYLNEENLRQEDCMFLYFVYRTHADTKCCNFANIFGYSFNLYSQKELIDYINQIPYEYKLNGKINLALTNYMYKPLLNIPYFSHCQYMIFKEKLNILVKKVSIKSKLKKQISIILNEELIEKIKNYIYPKQNFEIQRDYISFIDKIENEIGLTNLIDEKTFSDITDYLSFLGSVYLIRYAMRKCNE